jgi:hypothetical protein
MAKKMNVMDTMLNLSHFAKSHYSNTLHEVNANKKVLQFLLYAMKQTNTFTDTEIFIAKKELQKNFVYVYN